MALDGLDRIEPQTFDGTFGRSPDSIGDHVASDAPTEIVLDGGRRASFDAAPELVTAPICRAAAPGGSLIALEPAKLDHGRSPCVRRRQRGCVGDVALAEPAVVGCMARHRSPGELPPGVGLDERDEAPAGRWIEPLVADLADGRLHVRNGRRRLSPCRAP